MSLSLHTDRLLVRAAGGSKRYLHVSFRAPAAPTPADRRPLTVAFVLDRSGSMSGDKLTLAKRAIDTAISMLEPEDRFAVVAYDDRVDVVVPAMPASAEGRETARRRLDAIEARGATDLATGWLSGCEQIADVASDRTIARTLLLSDGLANHGITSHDEITSRAADLRRAYVVTSTFGVGADFDEPLMAAMADAGGGNFYFIERPEQILDMLTSELGEALEVVARRVVIDLELPDAVEAELMHQFRVTHTERGLQIELEDLVSNQQVSLIVKLKFPHGEIGAAHGVRARVSSEDESVEGTSELAWAVGDEDANGKQPRNVAVDRLVAAVEAARARRDAVELNRAGNFSAASDLLNQSAIRIARYAQRDREMNRLIDSLKAESIRVAETMDALARKRMYYQSSSEMRMREKSGRARRPVDNVELEVKEVDGHLYVKMPDHRWFVLATGSAVTLATTGSLELLGERFDVASHAGAVSFDQMRRHLGNSMDGLLGMDVLGRFSWMLDCAGGVMRCFARRPENRGTEVGSGSIAGLPKVRIHFNGGTAGPLLGTADALLDTGMSLSYMPASVAAGLSPTGHRRETIVLPEPMQFTADVFERPIRIQDLTVFGEFAVLPPEVPMPEAARQRWILGTSLLSRLTVFFDPQHGIVIFGDAA